MARKSKAKPSVAKKAKTGRKSSASAKPARSRRVSEMTTFRRGKDGKIFRMDVKTKATGKIISAAVGGRTKSVAVSR